MATGTQEKSKVQVNDFSWMIGGPQGTGVDSSATLFAKACIVAGLWIFGKREYHSNIKGDHSYFQIRVSDHEVKSHLDPVHLLTTYEDSTAQIHAHEVIPGGAIIYDPTVTHPENLKLNKDVTLVPLDYAAVLRQCAEEIGQPFSKLVIMKNTVSVAASFALLGLGMPEIEEGLKTIFTGKKEKLIPLNVTAAKIAHEAISKEIIDKFPYKLKPIKGTPKRLVLTGNQAVALGKLKAGCRFQTYYPITPASDESVYLEGMPEYGMLVMQCEDEIASVLQAISGAIMGARSSTSTSGPGFSLMAEGLGWAGMNEVPVVVVNYQRGGPATGLPTRHEQADLFFSIHFAHGEFPRIVLTPGDHSEYFYDAFESFNIADQFQTPVILLCDKNIGNNTQSIPMFDESKLIINRGKIATDADIKKLDGGNGSFKRFSLDTKNGVSTRSLPGQKGGIYWMSGDEHSEVGHIDESSALRQVMHAKRMKKLEAAAKEIPSEMKFALHGDKNADITLVSWGSPKGPILDALPTLQKAGINVNFLQVRMAWPFPSDEVTAILNKAKTVVGIEMNFTGQMCDLIRRETGIEIKNRILKWNGRPISETEIVDGVTDVIKNKKQRVELTGGL